MSTPRTKAKRRRAFRAWAKTRRRYSLPCLPNPENERRYQEALRTLRTDDAQELLRMATYALDLRFDRDAVEFAARYLCVVQGQPRNKRLALDVIAQSDPEQVARLMSMKRLARAIARVRAEEAAPVPEDMRLPAQTVLSPEAWARFVALTGIPAGKADPQ